MQKRRAFIKSAAFFPYSGGDSLLRIEGTPEDLEKVPHKWTDGKEPYIEKIIVDGEEVEVCNFNYYPLRWEISKIKPQITAIYRLTPKRYQGYGAIKCDDLDGNI